MGLLPDSILEGVGDSLLTAADRYAYTVSVPRMYNIVGREGVKALHSEKWQEAWEARRQQQAARAAQEKKKKAEKWEEAKREYDSVGGTPFHGVRAIARENNVAIARLKRYADRNAKRHHGYDTDSSALGGDSGSMILGMVTRTLPCRVFIFWGGEGGLLGHETVSTKYVPSKGPFLSNSLPTLW